MSRTERWLAWLVFVVAVGMFMWSLRVEPVAWVPGCVACTVIAGVVLVLIWTDDEDRKRRS